MKRISSVPLLAMLMALLLSACTTKREVIVQTEYVYIGVPKTLTAEIVPVPPPDKEEYIAANLETRTTMLTVYGLELLRITRQQNDRLTAIDKFDEDNRKSVQEFNQKERMRVQRLVQSKVQEMKNAE